MHFNPTDSMYRGAFLPHTDAMGRPQMITIRLADTIPKKIYRREIQKASNARERRAFAERYLDMGLGKCWLKVPENAQTVIETITFYDRKDYRLIDWVIMPNHIHVVYESPKLPIGKIAGRWKSYSAMVINKRIGCTGESFWQRDFFDRYARDPIHLYNMSCYAILNPVKAGLVDDPFDWEYSSIHDYHPDFKDDLRRWYREYRSTFWNAIDD
jgi:putative transposase